MEKWPRPQLTQHSFSLLISFIFLLFQISSLLSSCLETYMREKLGKVEFSFQFYVVKKVNDYNNYLHLKFFSFKRCVRFFWWMRCITSQILPIVSCEWVIILHSLIYYTRGYHRSMRKKKLGKMGFFGLFIVQLLWSELSFS